MFSPSLWIGKLRVREVKKIAIEIRANLWQNLEDSPGLPAPGSTLPLSFSGEQHVSLRCTYWLFTFSFTLTIPFKGTCSKLDVCSRRKTLPTKYGQEFGFEQGLLQGFRSGWILIFPELEVWVVWLQGSGLGLCLVKKRWQLGSYILP